MTKETNRPNYEGSVYKETRAGRKWTKSKPNWRAEVTYKGQRKSKGGFTSKGDGSDWATKAYTSMLSNYGLLDKETVNQTLLEAMTGWYEEGYTKDGEPIKHKTVHTRLVNIKRIAKFSISKVKVADLTTAHIQKFYKDVIASNQWSQSAVRQLHSILNSYLNSEDAEKILGARTPMKNVKNKPSIPKTIHNTLDAKEVRLLLEIDDEWTPLWAVLVFCGLRVGEALGLRWQDINLSNNTFVVVQQAERKVGVGLVFETPKTKESRAVMHIGAEAVGFLKKQMDRVAKMAELTGCKCIKSKDAVEQAEFIINGHKKGCVWGDNDLVFPNEWGGILESTRTNRALTKALLGITSKHIRVQDLRRTCGTLMYENGVGENELHLHMRHTDFSTTRKYYIDKNPARQREASEILEDVITKSS